MNDVNKVKVVVLESHCDCYRVGDEIVFDGPLIDKDKSADLCLCALQSVFPYIFASRKGALWDTPVQCPDCDEKVVFKIEIVK